VEGILLSEVAPFDAGLPAAARKLHESLLAADSGAVVVAILKAAGLWDDEASWRLYGDAEDNFSAAGNQQRNADAALVEKAINSLDACLMGKALERGIDPRSPEAPRSPREAVAIFYEGADPENVRSHQGNMADWTRARRTEVSRDITIALTGPIGAKPGIVIADSGEGQSPDRLPDTILSLMKGIKKSIPFVQGKFNMGGTGALRFCGPDHLQLVLSKRDPRIAAMEGSSTDWGFTIVRRERPTTTTRVSTYRYLAPLGAAEDPGNGGVLRFGSDSLPIFPEGQNPYGRASVWGTLIKLYEYDTRAKGAFFRRDGLLERLDIMMPGLMLPIRLHECRAYGGDSRSFETTLTGLEVRLRSQEKEEGNLEPGFPDSGEITIRGETIRVWLSWAGHSSSIVGLSAYIASRNDSRLRLSSSRGREVPGRRARRRLRPVHGQNQAHHSVCLVRRGRTERSIDPSGLGRRERTLLAGRQTAVPDRGDKATAVHPCRRPRGDGGWLRRAGANLRASG
jgi:hypothetical protein